MVNCNLVKSLSVCVSPVVVDQRVFPPRLVGLVCTVPVSVCASSFSVAWDSCSVGVFWLYLVVDFACVVLLPILDLCFLGGVVCASCDSCNC